MRKLLAMILVGATCFSLAACGSSSTTSDSSTESTTSSSEESTSSSTSTGTVDNSYAEDTDALVEAYADQFEQVEYTDEETGLSITYNVFLPEGYDESESYPTVFFIGDSSCTGDDATTSLTQGRGALVWAADEWQEANPTIVIVPSYPETILDDHGSFTTTEYVEMTKNFIEDMEETYAVDTDRVYGTGQSMGCMTTLILATEYPDLYTACMFVDGQWDTETLSNLEDLTFAYFAAEDDTNAYNGITEVMSMFDEDGASYEYAQWDGTWSTDELSEATEELFSSDSNAYFISWESGTIEPKSTGMSGGGSAPSGESFGGPGSDSSDDSSSDSSSEKKEFAAPSTESDASSDSSESSTSVDSSAYHMASFDYAYRCIAVMEWLFEQTK
ncbi:MAG: prolyl oligopeptidase family serine peptidase [Eubacterium sp.]|nr:prolyl oligopeptidase family serine peptidase [Eubacterium sp.]